jgi:hypothetical protein
VIFLLRKDFDAACNAEPETAWLCPACVIADQGEFLYVDEKHPAAPKAVKALVARSAPEGAGTEMHALLARFGLTASGDCKCNKRAAYLDEMGCDWAEANIDEVVGWLRESAAERGLPFLDVAGRMLVRRAIANARKAEARRAKEAEAAAAEGPAA